MEFNNTTISLGLEQKISNSRNFWGFSGARDFRYLFSFETEVAECTWLIRDFISPVSTTGYSEMNVNGFKFPVHLQRDNRISLTFISPVGEFGYHYLAEWIRLYAESVTGRLGFTSSYKKNIKIQKLDPTGIVVETLKCYGVQIISVTFDDLSLDYTNINNIHCDFALDYFTIE